MAYFIAGPGDSTWFLFSGDCKVSTAFYVIENKNTLFMYFFSHVLGLTSSTQEVYPCPEWEYSSNFTAHSNAVKQPRPKTKACIFWKSLSQISFT